MRSPSLAFLAATFMLAAPLQARADDQDLDSVGSDKPEKKAGTVREVVRGFYVKGGAGSLLFVGPRGSQGLLQPGTVVTLGIGQDFIDKEKASAAWEVFFHQSLNNGAKYFQQAGLPNNLLIQGDIHTFTGGLAGEYSTYVTRRLGVGARVGGGVSLVPLLMDENEYLSSVVNDTWGAVPPNVHRSPIPVAFGGPTVEYYTKLSHFSVGADVVFSAYIGLDLAIDITGYMKYTF